MRKNSIAQDFLVKSRSRADIANQASDIRKLADTLMSGGDPHFLDILGLLDRIALLPNGAAINYKIIPYEEMLSKYGGADGLSLPESRLIYIREDVYLGADEGVGKDRFTIAHELGHCILHSNEENKMARTYNALKPYESAEWQANCFAGELLMNRSYYDYYREIGFADAAKLCGVSYEAMNYQLTKAVSVKNKKVA